MVRLLIFIVVFATAACKSGNTKNNVEIKVFKKYNYHITVDIWNGFFGHESKFILNNSNIDIYDSADDKSTLSRPFTLYLISYRSKKDGYVKTLIPTDTTEIPFTKNLSDTLFILTKDFFKSVEFNNYDTVGQITPIITDYSHSAIELSFNGRKLAATISSIHNPTIATKQLDTLLNFVDKFIPVPKK